MFDFIRRRRHARLAAGPFPPELAAFVTKNVPYVARLPVEERAKLDDLIQIFLAEKLFEGANGLEVTDEMRVTVAAQACILLLGFEDPEVYPDLARVVLYPSAYKAKRKAMHGAVLQETEEVRLGESWDRGVVVLAWSAVVSGARDERDGHNVVFHELAHQLDQEHGDADGAPELPRGMAYSAWGHVLGAEFTNLEAKAEEGRPTLLDFYGATNAAEFFAVATETFFEKPLQMKARKPDLYAQLASYYRQDPAAIATLVDPVAKESGRASGKSAKKGGRKKDPSRMR